MKKLFLLISIFVFSYGAVDAATVTTAAASSITYEEATLNGSADPVGLGAGTFDVYFKYWEVPAFGTPTYYYEQVASGITSGSGSQTYSFNWTGLDPATDYAYTIFIAHGNIIDAQSTPDQTFTTLQTPAATSGASSNITKTSADLAGAVTLGGSSQSHNLYFQYRIGADSWSSISASPATTTIDQNSVTGSLTGLTAGTTYQWRMYMENTNTNPVGVYEGNIQSFTTVAPPTVVTLATSLITVTSATLNGELTAPSGETYSVKFRYKISGGFAWTEVASNQGSLTGNGAAQSFDANITGLSSNTSYEVEAFFVDNTVSPAVSYYAGDATGNFTTDPAGAPTVTTGNFGAIAATSGEITGNSITDNGGSAITSYGLAHGASASPTTEKEQGTSAGATPFNYNVSGTSLTPSKKYYVRAYVRNSVSTSYGSDLTFYTEPSSVTLFDAITGLDPNDKTTLTLNFGGSTQGNGSGVIIKAAIEGSATITQPIDGTQPAANPTYTANNQVVYVGSNSGSVVIKGLDGTKDYEFQMWEYSGSGDATATDYGINYKTDVLPQRTRTNTTEFPIELLSFTAKNDNGNVLINWATATEIDNDFFEIERSTDAENFEVIANVPGAGYSNEVLNYSIQDNDALEGTVYYRLKQTDFNGEFTYSYVLPVQIGVKNELQISNIINTDNSISFIYNNNQGGNTLVELYDMSGRVVKSQQVSGDASQKVRMNMRGMSRGIYVLHLTLDNQMITKKVIF